MSDHRRRLQDLADEIRHYPSPIARCDEQLTALLEERARLMNEMKCADRIGGCSAPTIWINDGGFDVA